MTNHRVTLANLHQTGTTAWVNILLLILCLLQFPAWAAARDGGIDPANLGKGDWIYFMSAATNALGGQAPSVMDEASLMKFYKSQNISWVVVKAATSDQLFNGSYSFPQFNSNLVEAAHVEGIKIFGYNRSYGENIPGEIAIADYVFAQGADGFVFDAEAEWENSRAWIGQNGPALAMQLCSAVRSNWPTKFLAHAPLPIINYHSSFPYREFGYWCDAVMPQDYWKSIGITPEYMVQWRNTEWHNWENSLTGIWTNAIKPMAPIAQGWSPSLSETLTGDEIRRYFDALRNDPSPPGKVPYSGISFWRADLHTPEMWDAIRTNTIVDTTTNPPVILQQPQDVTVLAGQSATFQVEAAGTAPLRYWWRLDGMPIPGATQASYTRAYAQPADAGAYSVLVSNKFGTSLSADAVLIVTVPPSITAHPSSQWVTAGQPVTFSVTAQGTAPLYYQWKRNGTNLANALSSELQLSSASLQDAGTYSVLVTNVAGSLVSASATLNVTLSPVPPVILSQPQDRRASPGRSVVFEVAAQGTTPLSYQWRLFGTNIPLATRSALFIQSISTNDAGPYSVIVSNIAGSTLSSNALLTIGAGIQVTELWNLPGGSRDYLRTSSQYERGMAYNPLTDRLLVVSRAISPPQIYVLDGTTGEDLYTLNIDSSVVNGGTYTLNMIGVADDGAVYAVNLAPSGTGFKVYRWNSDGPDEYPAVAFSGNPAPNDIQRWGDTIDVRGAGPNTQILVGSRNGRAFAVLTTTDGFGFTASPFTVPELSDGGVGLGIAFGPGNTLYGKAITLPLVRIGFNLSTGTATLLRSFENEEFPSAVSPIGTDTARGLLGGIFFQEPDTLNLYDVSQPDEPPRGFTTNAFGSDNVNGFNTGSVDFGGNRVYALNSNNGLLALELSSDTPPEITAQPVSQQVIEGTPVTISVVAVGATPLNYQWLWFGTNLPGANAAALILAMPGTNQSGPYSVRVSNQYGAVTSDVAVLTIKSGLSIGQAVDEPTLPWLTGGTGFWLAQTNVSFDGSDAAQSGRIGDYQTNYISTAVTGPGTLTFMWKVSSEQSFDFLTFLIDGFSWTQISGEEDWTQVSVDLEPGMHTLRWEYSKDSVVASGSDCGWVDTVEWIGPCSNCPPRIARQPVSVRTVLGASATFSITAYGEGLSYQWRHNGVALPGETNSSLTLPAVAITDEGPYSVVLTNTVGVAVSMDAMLTVISPVAQVIDDFDPGIDLTQWYEFGGQPGLTVVATNIGGSVSGTKSLWFGGEESRYATAYPVQVGSQGLISYALRYGNSGGLWEIVDLPYEAVILEYSRNGGAAWTTLMTHASSDFYQWKIVSTNIPPAAQNGNILFRWRQLQNSGSCCDQWALDDVRILPGTAAPVIAQQPLNLTVTEGRPARFSVGAWGTGPLTYRWYFNGTLIPGASLDTLTVMNAQLTNDGTYSVIVSNAYGQDASQSARLTVLQRPPCVAAPTNILAWWRAEDDTTDTIGLADLGVAAIQALPMYAEGKVGGAFRFAGGSLRLGYSPILDIGSGPGFTIEAWVQPDGAYSSLASIAEWVDIASSRVGGGLALTTVSGQLCLQGTLTATNGLVKTFRSPVGGIKASNWQHVALTYSRASGLASLWINGLAVTQTNVGSMYLQTRAPFYVGTRGNITSFQFRGLMDELSVYGRALAAAELQDIFNAGAGGKCPPPPASCVPLPADAVAWWKGESNALDSVMLNDAVGVSGINYTNGKVGTALAFNFGYLRVPKSPDLDVGSGDGLTVEGWAKVPSSLIISPIIEWSDSSRVGVGLLVNYQGAIEATISATNVTEKVVLTPGDRFTFGVWQHLALTYSRQNGLMIIYLNGAELVRTNIGSIRPATGNEMYLGYRRSGRYAGQRLVGSALDEFTAYKRVLSEAEIASVALARQAGKCVPPKLCLPPPAGIVAWWKGETNTLDRLGSSHAIGQNVGYIPGVVDLGFTASSGAISLRVPASERLDVGKKAGFTFEAWVKSALGSGPLVEWNNGSDAGVRLWISEPGFGTLGSIASLTANIVDTNGVSHPISAPVLTEPMWQHVALTYDKVSGVAAMYINGNAVVQTNLGSFVPQTSYSLYLCYRAGGKLAGAYFPGGIDEPTLYDRALTPFEIKAIALARGEGKCDDSPVIVRHPQSLTVNEGETVVFQTEVAGTPPLRFQWLWNLTEILSQGTNASLVLTNVQYSQKGIYHLTVTSVLGSANSAFATLTVNRRPLAIAQGLRTSEDMAAPVQLTGSDPDGDGLTFSVVAGPNHGSISGTGSSLVYTPLADYWGPDAFQFIVDDGKTNSTVATVAIEVAPVNDPPVAAGQILQTEEDASLAITLSASDVDGDALTYSVAQSAHGTVSGTPPIVLYTPGTNFTGLDMFTFQASDGKLTSEPAEVQITVTPLNDAPVAVIEVSPLALIPGLTNLLVISTNGLDARVTLDGSGSTDAENDALTYEWLIGTNWLSNQVVAQTTAAIGSHEVTLVVSDGQASGTNAVAFEVIAPGEAASLIAELIRESGLTLKEQQPLLATLKSAMAAFDRGSTGAGLNQLEALKNKVAAQLGRTHPAVAAEITQAIGQVLGSWQ